MFKTRRLHRVRFRSATAPALVALAALAVAGGPGPARANPVDDQLRTVRDNTDFTRSYAPLVQAVVPAVVNVKVVRRVLTAGEGHSSQPQMDEFMKRFFGPDAPPMPERRGRPQAAVGSGFIIDEAGHVVTNAHVAKEASSITVTTSDGKEYEAELVGLDEKTDLALLKIEADGPFPFVRFGDSTEVQVGDKVIAVGNPFGLGGSVTAGIISAKGREVGAGPYDDFLQVDAPINRGNSGGPTFNLDGEVIGVNTLIFSPSGGNVGIAFAISANLAKEVIADLMDDGKVERGWLGVRIQPVDEDIAAALGLAQPEGALVSSVDEGSPAAAAGLAPGDVILEFNGKKITKLRDLTRAVAEAGPGKAATVRVLRKGSEQTLTAVLGQMPDTTMARAEPRHEENAQPRLGLALAPLDEETRQQLGLEGEQGALVTRVQPDGPAAAKGLEPGDVITAIGGRKVASPADVAAAVKEAYGKGKKAVLLKILRRGQARFVAVPFAIS